MVGGLVRREPGPLDVAIVGIGCRFPGGASTPGRLWDLLLEGREALVEVPPDRYDVGRFHDPGRRKPGTVSARQGGFVDGIDRFDAGFYGLAPREALRVDPQQRLLLEVAWEATEDAGVPMDSLAGTSTGVFVGVYTHDYGDLQTQPQNRDLLDAYTSTSISLGITASRIAFLYDLRGPSLSVDTACSSSLTALHLACASLTAGESAAALVGGVNVALLPEWTIALSQASMLSPEGRCRAFDARASGFVRSEGCGVVLLKRLDEALADGDRVYAVIKGTAVNTNGQNTAITTPSQAGQEQVMRDAYARAGIEPGRVLYVEAHGTGTPTGDPVEAAALGAVMACGREPGDRCLVGSIKTNIGHLESAAGIAGLIKAALVLHHGEAPPNAGLGRLNPAIPFDDLPLRIARARETLPDRGRPRVVGVNAFGFGGTNAHVVLEAAPRPDPPPQASGGEPRARLLTLSARSEAALTQAAVEYRALLANGGQGALLDVARSAALHRAHHRHRLAVVAATAAEAVERLDAHLAGEPVPDVVAGAAPAAAGPRLAFVFSGMGPQRWAMGRRLLRDEPVFAAALEAYDRHHREIATWSVLDELYGEEATSRMRRYDVALVANAALQIALAALLRSWGVEPDAVVGHSAGEVAAAHVAGILDLEQTVAAAWHRARLQALTTGRGGMLAAALRPDEAAELVRSRGGAVSVAAINSPTSVTLSGDSDVLAELERELRARSVLARLLDFDVPTHHAEMDAIREELLAALAPIRPGPARLPMYSTTLDGILAGGEVDAGYWWRNVRQPVLFAEAVGRLLDDRFSVFLQIGPHPALATAIAECAAGREREVAVVATLRRQADDTAAMQRALAAMHCAGRTVAWPAVFRDGGRRVELPLYPWQRERFWFEGRPVASGSARADSAEPVRHPLLGRRLRTPGAAWEAALGSPGLAYLEDHRVHGTAVHPAAAYVAAAVEAGCELFGEAGVRIEDLELRRMLPLDDRDRRVLQLRVEGEGGRFEFHSASGDDGDWTLHASGVLRAAAAAAPAPVDLDEIRARSRRELTAGDCYARLAAMGLEYGPAFRGIRQGWIGPGEALADVELPERDGRLDVALLDAAFQALALVADPHEAAGRTWLPVRIGSVRVHGRPGSPAAVRATVSGDGLAGRVLVLRSNGEVAIEVEGLLLRPVGTGRRPEADPGRWLYRSEWEPAAALAAGEVVGSWLVIGDDGGAAETLARRLGAERRAPDAELDAAELGRVRGVVHLGGLAMTAGDGSSAETLMREQAAGAGGVLRLVRQLALLDGPRPRLWLVTGGAQAPEPELGPARIVQSPLWGLGRAVAAEHPELGLTMIDLGPEPSGAEVDALVAELAAGGPEDEISLRGARRWVRRVLPGLASAAAPVARRARPAAAAASYRLEIGEPGALDTLRCRPRPRVPPGHGQVEIRVEAAGLNFKDVMHATGMLPAAAAESGFGGSRLGVECVGTVAALGEGVVGLELGQRVIAMAPAAFATFTTTTAALVVPCPDGLAVGEAATLPCVFVTALHALERLAGIAGGERVLVHAAAGGVGLAAVQVARRAGAEVLATAGSPEKREYLRSLGIAHVMDSRTLDFADEVMELTDGRGVDVVLNSLAGDAIARGLRALAPYGRFVEIGRRDIDADSRIGLLPFRRNISFFAMDLDRLCHERPLEVRALLERMLAGVAEGTLFPLPRTEYRLGEAEAAFRHMAQARHVGKVVLRVAGEAPALPAAGRSLDADGTYVVTGGTSGFGMAVAEWMAGRGARRLALLGRRAATPELTGLVERLAARGVEARPIQADVTDVEHLAAVLEDLRRASGPLRGVVHAAMVLDDCPAVDLDEERFRAAVAPKLMGAWNLHLLTRRDDLDLFVLFSSVVTTLGNPTQANYSAGNVFLEMLALQRRARGLPGLAIQWGVLGGGGVVARDRELGERLERRGFLPLERRDALDALGRLLDRDPGVAIAARMDWSRWARFAPGALGSPRLSEVLAEGVPSDSHPSAASTVIASVAAAAPADRRPALEGHVVRLLATVLGTSADRVDPTLPMNEVGLDSLIAVELTTTLRASLGVEVPVVRLLDGVSPRELAERLLPEVSERLGPGPEPPPPPKEPVPSGPARPVRWSRSARVLRPLVWLSFRAVARLEIEGPGSCPPDGPLIVATNHVSFLDAPLVLTVVPRPTVVLVTDVMRRVPVVATFLRAFGSIFVRRGEGDVDALAKALEVLSAGGAVAIAPEGRRSSHGLIQGQSGVSHLAMASCSPVLPLAAFGQERLSRRWWMLRRSRVTVRLGPLVEPPPPGATALQLAAHTERVMTSLAALLPGPYQGRYREFVED